MRKIIIPDKKGNKEFLLSYSVLGYLICLCECTFTNDLPKFVKGKEHLKHSLLTENLLISINNNNEYIPNFTAHQIYFSLSDTDRKLAYSLI